MRLQWTRKAVSDLARLHEFLASAHPSAAARVTQSLGSAPANLLQHPCLGEKLAEFDPREVRRILVGSYEIRYEIQGSEIYVLRIWHTREKR